MREAIDVRLTWVVSLVGLLVCGGTSVGGCQTQSETQYVRGSEEENLDERAMSTRLDRRDLNRMYEETSKELMNSEIVQKWNQWANDEDEKAPVVAIFPMHNGTDQDLELDVLLSKFESDLVDRLPVKVVDHNRQSELIAEIKRQQSDAYNPTELSRYGRQMGAQYYVTGKIYGVREEVDGEKRQQYFLHVQVLNVETGGIKFDTESNVTKGLVE